MIVLGCDHGGLAIKNAIAADLKARGVEYKDVGTYTEESVDYPVYLYSLSAFSEKNSAALLFFPSFRYNLYKISIDSIT